MTCPVYKPKPKPGLCDDYIYVGANGSYELKQSVLSLFSDLYGIVKELDSGSYRNYPYPKRNRTRDEYNFEQSTRYTFTVRGLWKRNHK